MKHILFVFLLSFLCIDANAQQTANPVLMHINGKAVTRGEFEYAYNKNNSIEGAVEQKTVAEYLDMFINYKLKVAAAEALRMDTLQSFRDEFRTYRDMQLTPALIDQAFIDSVARSLYDRQAKIVDGKDLLTVSHILFLVKQTATEAEKQAVAQRADSAYDALVAGADFAELAKAVSQDPGSAPQGGLLPTIYPGMTIKEFEDQAYALEAGQFCRPFLSTVGYHIVWVQARKPLESFEALYPTILQSLKRQNIEEASAEHRINQLIANGKSREEIMDSVLQLRLEETPDLRYLIQEYHDGLLLYEVAKQTVWDVAAQDEKGLAHRFQTNKKKYAWAAPRFKGFIISAKNKSIAKKARKLLKNGLPQGKELREYLQETLNKDSVVVMASGQHLVEKGENSTIDHLAFGNKQAKIRSVRSGYPVTLLAGRKMKRPQTYHDVKSQVVADHQQALEAEWVKELRKRFSFTVDESVLKTVNNH
ncbi:peptidylprolyl isomerase [Alloprevotella sp. OH1205_COT-284]|uniref:peptidylprolyl isomerase n=1 Tax=Alloprevotella sp. OH1205_COT-284 TaxID=2491043 RepID=UPI00131596A6|nr:peptidylprolyl isomerase [Alloprevotella sp. OH1205_COT-284]